MEVALVGDVELDEVVSASVKLEVTTVVAQVVHVATPVGSPVVISTELELNAGGNIAVAFPRTSSGVVGEFSDIATPAVAIEATNHTDGGDGGEVIDIAARRHCRAIEAGYFEADLIAQGRDEGLIGWAELA